MPYGHCLWMVALLIGFSVTATPCAHAAEPVEIKTDPQTLVIGDWYEVSTKLRPKGDEEGKPIEGLLVKTTADWIVLGYQRSATCETFRFPVLDYVFQWCDGETLFENCPLLAEILYCGFFTKDVTYVSKNYLWLPRATTNITKRESEVNPKVKGEFQNDNPTLKHNAEELGNYVICVSEGKVTQTYGSTFTLEEGELTVVGQESRLAMIEDPLWGKLPIIGHNFNNRRVVTRDVLRGKFPLGQVAYISQEMPYKEREAGRANEKHVAN